MSRRIEHSSSYPFPAAQVHAAYANEQYWLDRLAEVGGDNATLTEFTETADGGVAIAMTQAILAENLPAMVTSVRPGDLIITRTVTWSALDGDQAQGAFTAEVGGAPAKIGGTQALSGSDAASTVTFNGSVEVNIPLFGSKIESAIADQILALLGREDDFTIAWLSR